MAAKKPGFSRDIVRFLGSDLCWYLVLGFFGLQAVWLALSAAYPMAFDERFHFGLIQLHAQQWLPFFTAQPDTGTYGDALRDPSYLYHWLMSFPYRLISAATNSQTAQIIFLRLINVALFGYALVLYRRILRRIGVSAAASHAALLAFVLIPVTTFLAATINYDNLLVVAVGWSVLLTLDILDSLKKGRLPLAKVLVLGIVLLLSSLIKYPFLPIMLVIGLALLWRAWRERLLARPHWGVAWSELRGLALLRQVLLAVVLLATLGLFAERYFVNIALYHTPVPACDQVQSDDVCLQYGPWQRDYNLALSKASDWHPHVIHYVITWFNGMWFRLFFAIGPEPHYDTQQPLFVISRLAIAAAVLLTVGLLLRWRHVFAGHPERALLFWIIIGYGLALFADDFMEYVHTGQAVAINGRYWLPLLPFFFGLSGLAWQDIMRQHRAVLVYTAAAILAVFLLQGGGVMTYIVRGNPAWYWPGSPIGHVNQTIKSAVSPWIAGVNLFK